MFHHAFLQNLGRIAAVHVYGFLENNSAAVRNFVDVMNGRACKFHAPFYRRFVHFKPVKPLAAERGNKRRVNVDNLFGVSRNEFGAEYRQKSGKNYKVGSERVDSGAKMIFERPAIGVVFFVHDRERNAVFLGARKRVSGRIVRNDPYDLCVRDLTRLFRVEDRLQIRAAARNENDDVYFSLSIPYSFIK